MLYVIVSLLLIGIVLIVIELILIPGTTLVGLLGFIVTVAGIVFCYRQYGNDVGLYVLISAAALMLATLFFSFRFQAWSRFSLKSAIKSKVNEGMLNHLHIGDSGIAISALRPFGKAQINDQQYEVRSTGPYVNHGAKIKVINISLNQITVEPLT
jgi:membrane-bound ClpP family serine protease